MFGCRAHRLVARFSRQACWHVHDPGNKVFLTFDDGPDPRITPWVLDTLAHHGAQASFFCLGQHAVRHSDLITRIRAEGHTLGHHTWDHPDGWRMDPLSYLRNVLRGAHAIGGPWFRPPYGHVPPGMVRLLSKRFHLIMWDVLAGDFRPGTTGRACAEHVLAQARAGSIIVLHDNPKSTACLRDALRPIIEGLQEKGYTLAPLANGFNSCRSG